MNKVIVYVENLEGAVETSASGTKYLKGGKVTVSYNGKQTSAKASWVGKSVKPEAVGKGGVVLARIDVEDYNGTYPSLKIEDVVTTFSNINQVYLTGKVVEVDEQYDKFVIAQVEITDSYKELSTNLRLLAWDKSSINAEIFRNSVGKRVFVTGAFVPSDRGFIDFKVESVSPAADVAQVPSTNEVKAAAPKATASKKAVAEDANDLPF